MAGLVWFGFRELIATDIPEMIDSYDYCAVHHFRHFSQKCAHQPLFSLLDQCKTTRKIGDEAITLSRLS